MEQMTLRTEKNQLDHPKMYRLGKWVEATAQEHATRRDMEVAEVATRALGFTVSAQNIRSARRLTGVGTNIERRRGSKGKVDRLYHVAKQIILICNALAIPVSKEVQTIVEQKKNGALPLR